MNKIKEFIDKYQRSGYEVTADICEAENGNIICSYNNLNDVVEQFEIYKAEDAEEGCLDYEYDLNVIAEKGDDVQTIEVHFVTAAEMLSRLLLDY